MKKTTKAVPPEGRTALRRADEGCCTMSEKHDCNVILTGKCSPVT
jgi:hypothetical protein